MKHLFKNNICEYTGQTKDEIIMKDFSKDDLKDLIQVIQERRQFNIDTRVYAILDDIIESLIQSNPIFQNDSYIVQFKEKLNKKVNLDKLWKDLNSQIEVEVDTITSVLSDKLKVRNMDSIKDILMNMGELRNTLQDDIIHDRENPELNFYIYKEKLLKSFVNTYLRGNLLKIVNNYNPPEDPYIPIEWNVDKDTQDNLKKILSYKTIYSKYRNLNTTVFRDSLAYTVNNFEQLLGKIKVVDCNDKELRETLYTHKHVAQLLHYSLLIILSNIVKVSSESLSVEGDLFLDMEMDGELEQDELDITRELERGEQLEALFIRDILNEMSKDTQFLDKHTRTYMNSVIEKTNENNKEANLRFIQDLDKEVWSSLKTLISLGMDTWKSLSNKNKKIYIPEDEPGEEVVEDTESSILQQASDELGPNYTNEEYRQWREDYDSNQAEERQIQREELDLRSVVRGEDDEDGGEGEIF
jgi:hypothetical protein